MRFSASMLKTWMACPKQAHFKDILHYPEPVHCKTVYGSCIHAALECFNHTGSLKEAQQRFLDTWDNPSLIGAHIDVWPVNMSWSSLKSRGLDALKGYAESEKWDPSKILAIEHKFEIPFAEHTMSGIIDQVEVSGSGNSMTLRVRDYKTSSYTPTHLELRTNIQFTIYMWAVRQPEFWASMEDGDRLYDKYRKAEVKGIWHSLWTGRKSDVGPRHEIDLMRLYRLLCEIERAVENEVFVPSISADTCIYCPYAEVCAVSIPIMKHIYDERESRLRR